MKGLYAGSISLATPRRNHPPSEGLRNTLYLVVLLWFFLLTSDSFFRTVISSRDEFSDFIRTIRYEIDIAAINLLLVLAGGCASGPKTYVEDIDWRSRIGTYTFEEAYAELGQPKVICESIEGRTAEWVLRQSPPVTIGFGLGTGSYGGHTATGAGVGTTVSPPPSGEYLRLRFDKDDKLAEWTKVKY